MRLQTNISIVPGFVIRKGPLSHLCFCPQQMEWQGSERVLQKLPLNHEAELKDRIRPILQIGGSQVAQALAADA